MEEAVQVVPVESIFFAISHSDYDTGVKCAEALLATQQRIPVSEMMIGGAQTAIARMRTGVHGADIDKFVDQAIKKLASNAGTGHGFFSLQGSSCNKLKIALLPTVKYVTKVRCPMHVHSYAKCTTSTCFPTASHCSS